MKHSTAGLEGSQMSPAHRGKFVSYLRVSTTKQGADGLGIDAQRQAVAQYLNGGSWKLLREFCEVESGKKAKRPQLEQALQLAKVSGARLLVAKLDRLSRDAGFLYRLRDAGVRFTCCDVPDASELTIGVLAVVAEDEARRISARTKAALAAAKARGTLLGDRTGANLKGVSGYREAVATLQAKADARAKDVAPILADIEQAGITSHRGIAAELNAREIPSPRGKLWNEFQVARLRRRLQALDTKGA
jgi:DNA invertase Pin-like site-specific DNA recombinase